MDPLSITLGVISLLKTCHVVGKGLKELYDAGALADTKVKALLTEVESFIQVTEMMKSTLEQDSVRQSLQATGHIGNHWNNLATSLVDCQVTIVQVQDILDKVNKSVRILDGTRKSYRLKAAAEELAVFQHQIRAYKDTLQLSLQTIILWNQVTSKESTDQILPNLDELHVAIRQIASEINTRMASLENTIETNQVSQLRTLGNLRNCVQSAASVVSSASTAYGVGISDATTEYGSEFGDCFPPQQNEAMLRWISSNTLYEYEAEPRAKKDKGKSLVTPKDDYSDFRPSSESDNPDSDHELELEMIQSLYKKGSTKMGVKDYEGAERLCKNCLARIAASSIPRKRTIELEADIVELLCYVYETQQKWDQTKAFLLQRIKSESAERGTFRSFCDLYSLAFALAALGSFTEALLYGRKALKGFRKFAADQEIERCLQFLISIYRFLKDPDEEDAYMSILSDHQERCKVKSEAQSGKEATIGKAPRLAPSGSWAHNSTQPRPTGQKPDGSLRSNSSQDSSGFGNAAVKPTKAPTTLNERLEELLNAPTPESFITSAAMLNATNSTLSPSMNLSTVGKGVEKKTLEELLAYQAPSDNPFRVDQRAASTHTSIPNPFSTDEEVHKQRLQELLASPNVSEDPSVTLQNRIERKPAGLPSTGNKEGDHNKRLEELLSSPPSGDTFGAPIPSASAQIGIGRGVSPLAKSPTQAAGTSSQSAISRNHSSELSKMRETQKDTSSATDQQILNPPLKSEAKNAPQAPLNSSSPEPHPVPRLEHTQNFYNINRPQASQLTNTSNSGLQNTPKLPLDGLLTRNTNEEISGHDHSHASSSDATALTSSQPSLVKTQSLTKNDARIHICPYQDCERGKNGYGFLTDVSLRGHMILVHNDTKPPPILSPVEPGDTILASATKSPLELSSAEPGETVLTPATKSYAGKVVLVGDGECGKTSVLSKLTYGTPPDPSKHTFGVFPNPDFSYDIEKQVLDTNFILRFHDSSGFEDFDKLRPPVYRAANLIVLCFTIELPDSLDNWLEEVQWYAKKVPYILVGLKKELRDDPVTIERLKRSREHPVTPEEGEAMASEIGAMRYLECSAMTGEGVDEIFRASALALAGIIRQKEQEREAKNSRGFRGMFRKMVS